MENLSSCVEVDALFAMLVIQVRELFRAEAAWSWLIVGEDELQLQHMLGVPAALAPHLQRIKMPASRERAIAQRLRRLGYQSALVVPLRGHASIAGMIAVGSGGSRRWTRIDGEMCRMLAQHAGILLDRLQGYTPFVSGEAPLPVGVLSNPEVQAEYLHLLNRLISRITHGLNNAMATINGRVELLLNRPHDQSTMQHLGATLRSITEANHLIRHIQNLVSGRRGQDRVMVDLNQLVRDSVQIARSTWFLEFRDTRVPIELTADLRPMPALPARGPALGIALLCLLRHAMDTLPPGGRLVIRAWTADEDGRDTVFISLADDTDQAPEVAQSPVAARGEGVGLLLNSAQTADSQRALVFVESVVYNLGGRIMVLRNAAGGTTTTLRFYLGEVVAYER
jgi:signal transduction histidine kinase